MFRVEINFYYVPVDPKHALKKRVLVKKFDRTYYTTEMKRDPPSDNLDLYTMAKLIDDMEATYQETLVHHFEKNWLFHIYLYHNDKIIFGYSLQNMIPDEPIPIEDTIAECVDFNNFAKSIAEAYIHYVLLDINKLYEVNDKNE